ncbi:hypothetical protein [Streptomyces huasconensis]|uniref:hypothetical protein n=1 Tax=Streptomyces huasconensis TaxID=1854574 RepID=UPI0033CBCB28
MLAAVAFVHHREHRDHVAHRGDVRVPDPGAGAGLGRAGGDIADVLQRQDGGAAATEYAALDRKPRRPKSPYQAAERAIVR